MSDCIEWGGFRNRGGYGRRYWRGKQWLTHRITWTEAHGPIPEGMDVLHKCDNPACMNIEHLYLGNDKDNARDRDSRNRRRAPKGAFNGRAEIHEFTAVRIKMLRGHMKVRDVSALLGINKSQVANIMRGDSWKHVTAQTRYGF